MVDSCDPGDYTETADVSAFLKRMTATTASTRLLLLLLLLLLLFFYRSSHLVPATTGNVFTVCSARQIVGVSA
jgi:hypothetical protein